MQNPRVDLVLRQLDSLPALPAVAARVLRATADDAPDAIELARAVESDPAIAARVLAAARRADSGVRDITSVERAVVRLGFRGVRNLVLALGVLDVLGRADDTGDHGAFSRGDFWRHCLAVACAAELIAAQTKGLVDPGEAFCSGLLHDLGKLALHKAFPKAYARVVRAAESLRTDIAGMEQEILGISHTTAGQRLCERWGMPESISEVVWLHNAAIAAVTTTDPRTRPLVFAVTLADQIARRLHLGYSGNHSFGVPRDALLRELKLGPEDVGACVSKLVPAVQERSGGLGLGDVESGQLYRQAIANADREMRVVDAELKEIRTQLAAEREARQREEEIRETERNRITDQAEAFEHLTRLSLQIGPDATTLDVLTAIATTANTELALAFSYPLPITGETTAAEVLLLNDGKIVWHDAIPEGGLGGAVRPRATDGIDALDWLTSPCGDRLPGDAFHWLPLLDGDTVIGGVIAPMGVKEIAPLVPGWELALRLVDARELQRALNNRLRDANRQLVESREAAARDRALVAVAELAAGAAHEMNNPLMVISGRSQLLYRETGNLRHKQAALAVYHNAGRLSEMITQLMRFARPDAGRPTVAWAKEIVDEAVKLAAVAAGGDIGQRRVEVVVPADLPQVHADIRQWARAVAAILENAIQATSEIDGLIRINVSKDLAGRAVILTVEDNGVGMDESTLKRAFDPFFSHQGAGRRRGMGLATALRLVECDGGTLTLDSRENEGTRAVFTISVDITSRRP